MSVAIPTRRLFLGHLFAACAAPAAIRAFTPVSPYIVRAGSLMPVRALDPILVSQNPWWNGTAWMGHVDSDELAAVIRAAFLPQLQAQLYKKSEIFLLRWNEQLYG
jgi:hypothetical protein